MAKYSFIFIIIVNIAYVFSLDDIKPQVNLASWRDMQLSKDINDDFMKMLDKEETLEKMHEMLQSDREETKWLNSVKNAESYRDTFIDDIKDLKKRAKRNTNEKEIRVTGDTILHIKSEMSDVIKSETDLNDVLKLERKIGSKETSESYVDGIMIHPSKFVYTKDSDLPNKSTENLKKETIPIFSNRRKISEVPDDYDDSIKRKYGQVLKSKRGFLPENEAYQADASFVIAEFPSSEILSELNTKQMLECSLPSDISDIVWFKEQEKVLIVGRMQLVRDKHLVIVEVNREDEGKWHCSGLDRQGEHVQADPLHLVVLVPPSPPYLEVFGRRLDPSNLFLPVKEGSALNLSCISEGGRPPATLNWDPAPPGIHISENKNQGKEGASSVALLNVIREHHNITISCVAIHPAIDGPMVTSTLLHVHYAPRFSISRVPGFGFPLAEGSAIALRCEVDSNPPSAPHWRKDEMDPPVAQSDDGFLNFTSVMREDSGWYKCIANHPLGNYSSIGYFLNVRYETDEVTKFSTDIQHAATKARAKVALGGAVRLQCPPESWGCWGHAQSKTETEENLSENIDVTTPSPRGMLYKEEDQFKCRGLSRNEAEHLKVLRDSNIVVKEGPSVYPKNRTITVKEGQEVSLEVEVCSIPPPTKLIWLTPERLLHIGFSYGNIIAHNITDSTKPSCIWARLSILETRIRHAGEYSLVARNSQGLSEALIQLAVQANMSAANTWPKATNQAISKCSLVLLVFLPLFMSHI